MPSANLGRSEIAYFTPDFCTAGRFHGPDTMKAAFWSVNRVATLSAPMDVLSRPAAPIWPILVIASMLPWLPISIFLVS